VRKFLFASIPLAAGLALAPWAKAQVPVIDSSNLAQNIVTAAQEVQAVEQLKAQLTQLENTYSMFTSPTNILNMAPGLENQTIENPMPAANALAGLVGGTSTSSGAASTYYNQNHIYSPTDGSPESVQTNENAQSIANIEGVASSNLSGIQQRLQDLPDLEADIQSATSINQVTAINGRIAAESQFVQAQQAQASNLQVLVMEQQSSQAQQQQEQYDEDMTNAASDMTNAAAANGSQ
jgi:type IV secretion system protein VirB5